MKETKISCAKCGGHVAFPVEMAGTEGSCPHCGENIFLPKAKNALAWIIVIVVIAVIGCAAAITVVYQSNHGHSVSNAPAHLSPFEAQQEKAAKGDPDAMLQLGQTYLNGTGVPTNTDEGMKWIQKAATAGNPQAMTLMGNSIWDDADKVFNAAHAKDPVDPATGTIPQFTATNIPAEAISWFQKAAELGETNAMWKLINISATGDLLWVTDDRIGLLRQPQPNKETIHWLKKLMEAGDTEAMINLGELYLHDKTGEFNRDEGISFMAKAGERGNLRGFARLGVLYKSGEGVPTDYFQAARWFEKAANGGETHSALDLGELYRDNEEIKDLQQSFKWFLNAAQKYDPNPKTENDNENSLWGKCALVPVAKAYDKGLGIAQNKTEAIKWYTKAAEEANDSEAQWRLGVKYYSGDGVIQDKQKALQWYLKAANTPPPSSFLGTTSLPGVAESQRNLGYMYRDGSGVAKKPQEAFDWFLKAAKNGSEAAQFELAEAYSSGVGVLQDKQEAFTWYQKAANGGNKSAQIKLAQFYLSQVNSPANSPENRIAAHVWLNLAAAQGYEDATQLRSSLVRKMLPKEVAEAQRLAKDFSVGTSLITNTMPILGALAFDTPTISAPDISDTPVFEVLNVTAKPTEQNDVWWRYGYRVTVRNNGQNTEGQRFHIQFLDAQGYVIDTTTTDKTAIRSGATGIITGETLLTLPGAARVAKLKATWNP